MKEYAVIFEQGAEGEEPWDAYVPDLPGCTPTAATQEEAERNIAEAIAGHIAALRLMGEPIPEPRSVSGTVAVAA